MRPGCKMLAGVSFLAANFLSRDWHFPLHSQGPGSPFRAGHGPLGTQTHTHTLGSAQPCRVDNIVIIRRSLWNPGVHSQTTGSSGEMKERLRLSRWPPGSITSRACKRRGPLTRNRLGKLSRNRAGTPARPSASALLPHPSISC